MFQGITEGAKKMFSAIGSYIRPTAPPEVLTYLIVGAKFGGKSTFTDRIIDCLNDMLFAASRKRLTIRPTKAAEGRDPARFPGRTGEPIPYPLWLSTGCGTAQVVLKDHPGEYLDFLQTEDPEKAEEKAKGFRDGVVTADGLIITLSPGDLFEKTEHELHVLLTRLVDLVNVAAAQARKDGRAFRVFLMFTKCEQYGEPGLGDPRAITGSRQRRAIEAVRNEKFNAASALVVALAASASATPEGLALRQKLVERSMLLWTGLAKCRELDPAGVHAYFVQASATWPGTGSIPWNRRGIPQLLEDLSADVRDRYSRPIPYWAIAACATLAVGGLVFATGKAGIAADTTKFVSAYRTDLVDRVPSKIGRAALVQNAPVFETARPWAPEDHPGRLAFLMSINNGVADFADRTAAVRGTPDERFKQLCAARAANLEWEVAIWPRLTAREQAAGASLRGQVEVMRELDGLVKAPEQQIAAVLNAARTVNEADSANVFAAAAKFEDERRSFLSAVQAVRASALKSRTYVRSGNGAVSEHSIGTDVIEPWCAAVERLIDDSRAGVVARILASVIDSPEAYRQWLLKQSDAEVAFLKDLTPELCLNPYSRAICDRNEDVQMVQWKWPSAPIYGFIRVRELPGPYARLTADEIASLPVYDIDFETRAVYEVRSGERYRKPLAEAEAGRFTLRSEALEVLGIWLKAKKTDAFERLPLTSRGDGVLWFPILLDQLKVPDAAIVGRPATGSAMHAEWLNLIDALSAMRAKQRTVRGDE